MELEKKQRIQWIDVARGLAILIVVLGHCIGNLTDPVNKIILAFHMPLFFFLSGYCVKVAEMKFLPFLKKKAIALLVPQITLGTISTVFGVLTGDGGGILSNYMAWFLLVMFYCSIIWYFVGRYAEEHYFIVLAVTIVAVAIMQIVEVTTIFNIEIAPMAFLFYLVGFGCKRYEISKKLTGRKSGSQGEKDAIRHFFADTVFALALPLIVTVSYWNTPVAMYDNDYGNLCLFFLGAFLGIYLICRLAKGIAGNNMLAWIGRNSIIVYVLHFKLIKVLHGVGERIFPQLDEINYLFPAYMHYFLICVLILMVAVFVCERWFAPLFGKRNLRTKVIK